MNFITENDEDYILISDESHLDEVKSRISALTPFADKFKFSKRELFIKLLEILKINYNNFTEQYFYYDSIRKLHVSESEFGYIWISTAGLVPTKKATKSRSVNACLNQYLVISLLFEKAIDVVQDKRVYDIDSYSSSLLNKLSPAIFHNLTFYIEVFCKAYLSLTKIKAPYTHSLLELYHRTVETMISKKHNNSLFQILVLDPLFKLVDHVSRIPGNFKEHFIKYDDNALDDSVILFDHASLAEMTTVLELSVDFITEYYYMGNKTHYLESNAYQRMLEKAETEEKKEKVRITYSHLVNS